nr:hypothetical protein [Pedobacter kyonggii]
MTNEQSKQCPIIEAYGDKFELVKDLLTELKERESNLLQQRSDAPFWCFLKIIRMDAEIKILKQIINQIKKFYLMEKIIIGCTLIIMLSSCSQKICPAYPTKHKIRGGYGTGYN